MKYDMCNFILSLLQDITIDEVVAKQAQIGYRRDEGVVRV
jgi:hypothetical protein